MNSNQTDLTIRRARDGDLPEMARLHLASFPGLGMTLQERIDRFRTDPRLALEDYWIAERGRQMVGLYALLNLHIHRMGTVIPAGGISMVSVAPEARRTAVALQLMRRALETMEQNEMPLSILYPFRHNFYRALGWGLIVRTVQYHLPPQALPNFSERKNVIPVNNDDDREAVMQCYAAAAARSNGLLKRTDAYWQESIFKNTQCYGYRNSDGAIEGYLTFRYKPHSPEESFVGCDLEIWDFIFTSRRALHGLIGFLSAQRDQVSAAVLTDQGGLPWEHIIAEPNAIGGRHNWLLGAATAVTGASLMGRIVNVKRALMTAGRWGSDVSGTVSFKLNDPLSSLNNEPVTVEFTEGRPSIVKKSASVTLSADISTFASLFWGALSLKDAILLGLVEIEGRGDAGFVTRMFTLPRPVCMDYF